MNPDARIKYRGPLHPIRTNVPGIEVCDYMPRQAKIAHKFWIIRSLHHKISARNDGSNEVLTVATGLNNGRLDDRHNLLSQFDHFRRGLDLGADGLDDSTAERLQSCGRIGLR